jgi:hypothetical protein
MFHWLHALSLVTVTEVITSAATSVLCVGVWMTWRQVRLAEEQTRTSFEDSMVRDFRDVMREIPIEALLGGELTAAQRAQSLSAFYRYFDLCNAQAYLHREGRIRPETWQHWRRGIKARLSRPEFRRAWDDIRTRLPDGFDRLRELDAEMFPERSR